MDLDRDDNQIRYRTNAHRVHHASETKTRLGPYLQRFGIGRVGFITGLDRLGAHVTTVIRPRSRTIAVFSGKGPTKEQAWVSGVMEAIETYCAERPHYEGKRLLGSYRGLSATHPLIQPADLILPYDSTYSEDNELSWVPGIDITGRGTIYVPEDTVFIPSESKAPLVEPTTNGLCSGTTGPEALLHGIYELIERDSCSIAEALGDVEAIEPRSVPDTRIAEIISHSERSRVDLRLYHFPSDLGISTFCCVLEDTTTRDPCFFNIGHGAHLDPLIAVQRAVYEAAQSRLLYIGGSREDLWLPLPAPERHRSRSDLLEERGMSFLAGQHQERLDYAAVAARHPRPGLVSLRDELDECIRVLAERSLSRIIVIDLTPKDFPFSVIRVLIPGLECYYSDQTRIGPRIRARIHG